MKVLVVYAHPNPQSFNHAVLEAFTRGLRDGGHTFEVVDLYAIKFDPVFKLADYVQFASGHVPKDVMDRMKLEDLVKLTGGKMPKDVLEQQEKIAQADALAFIYPVLFNNFPAILEGWIQRVFSHAFAWELTEKGWQGEVDGRIPLLKHKKALLINTTFFSEENYKAHGLKDAMEKKIDDWSLRYPGVQQVEHVYLYSVLAVDDETRKRYLELAYRLGKEF